MPSIQRALAGDVLLFDLSAERERAADPAIIERSGRNARTLLRNGPLRVTLVMLGAGGEISEHQADGPLTVQPLDGRLRFTVADTTHDIGPGDLLSVGAGVRHAVASTEGATSCSRSRCTWIWRGMAEFAVALASAIPDGEARGFEVDGHEVVLCRTDGEVYALSGICTHEDLPLDGGEIEDGVLTCPWHGARYDIRTGRVRALPAVRPLRVYAARVDADGLVYVDIDEG